MSIHVIAIEKTKQPDPQFIDMVANKVKPGSERMVIRPESVEDLVEKILAGVSGSQQKIYRLDLVGHANGGRFSVGYEPGNADTLITSAYRSHRRLRALRPYLSADSEVRLLGCSTAHETNPRIDLPDPRVTLLALTTILGCRIFGTRQGIDHQAFGVEGLKQDKESRLLVETGPVRMRQAFHYLSGAKVARKDDPICRLDPTQKLRLWVAPAADAKDEVTLEELLACYEEDDTSKEPVYPEMPLAIAEPYKDIPLKLIQNGNILVLQDGQDCYYRPLKEEHRLAELIPNVIAAKRRYWDAMDVL